MVRGLRLAAIAVAFASAGCDDFRPPSEIVEPQLLGVRVVPPGIAAGEQARVEFFVADIDGPITAVEVSWEVIAGPGGAPPLGSIGVDDDGVVYAAPAELDPEDAPATAIIQGTFALPQRDVVAVKAVRVGARRVNPQIEVVTLDGEPIAERGAVTPGAEVELDVRADIELEAPTAVTWAVTEGELERFLRTPVTWLVPENAEGTAWVYVVVRDDRGGVAWDALPIDIAP